MTEVKSLPPALLGGAGSAWASGIWGPSPALPGPPPATAAPAPALGSMWRNGVPGVAAGPPPCPPPPPPHSTYAGTTVGASCDGHVMQQSAPWSPGADTSAGGADHACSAQPVQSAMTQGSMPLGTFPMGAVPAVAPVVSPACPGVPATGTLVPPPGCAGPAAGPAVPPAGAGAPAHAIAAGAVGHCMPGLSDVGSWAMGLEQQQRQQYDALAGFDLNGGAPVLPHAADAMATMSLAQANWDRSMLGGAGVWELPGSLPTASSVEPASAAALVGYQRNWLAGQVYHPGYPVQGHHQLPAHPQDAPMPYFGFDPSYADPGAASMSAALLERAASTGAAAAVELAPGKVPPRTHQLPTAVQHPLRPPAVIGPQMPQGLPPSHPVQGLPQATLSTHPQLQQQQQQLQQFHHHQYQQQAFLHQQWQQQACQQQQIAQQQHLQAHQPVPPAQHQVLQQLGEPQQQQVLDKQSQQVADKQTQQRQDKRQMQQPDGSAKVPDLPPGVPTVGSLEHSAGVCRPCFYIHSRTGCLFGASCKFCHGDHPKMIRVRPTKLKRSECKALARRVFQAHGGGGVADGVSSSIMERAEAELLESKELKDADDVTLRYALMVLHALYKEVALP